MASLGPFRFEINERDRDLILKLAEAGEALAREIKRYNDGLIAEQQRDRRPHSRACGIRVHEHGSACHPNCPTCGGR